MLFVIRTSMGFVSKFKKINSFSFSMSNDITPEHGSSPSSYLLPFKLRRLSSQVVSLDLGSDLRQRRVIHLRAQPPKILDLILPEIDFFIRARVLDQLLQPLVLLLQIPDCKTSHDTSRNTSSSNHVTKLIDIANKSDFNLFRCNSQICCWFRSKFPSRSISSWPCHALAY